MSNIHSSERNGRRNIMAVAIRQLTYAQAINEAMRLEMRRDPRIILMREDVAGGPGGGTFFAPRRRGGGAGGPHGVCQRIRGHRRRQAPPYPARPTGAA